MVSAFGKLVNGRPGICKGIPLDTTLCFWLKGTLHFVLGRRISHSDLRLIIKRMFYSLFLHVLMTSQPITALYCSFFSNRFLVDQSGLQRTHTNSQRRDRNSVLRRAKRIARCDQVGILDDVLCRRFRLGFHITFVELLIDRRVLS